LNLEIDRLEGDLKKSFLGDRVSTTRAGQRSLRDKRWFH